jgi:hypothetical protein
VPIWRKLKEIFRGGSGGKSGSPSSGGVEPSEAYRILSDARKELKEAYQITQETAAIHRERELRLAQDLKDLEEQGQRQAELARDLKALREHFEKVERESEQRAQESEQRAQESEQRAQESEQRAQEREQRAQEREQRAQEREQQVKHYDILEKKYNKWKREMARLKDSDPDYKTKYESLMKERQALEDELKALEGK